ncbi:MAG: hypothetical protein Q8R82_21630 [Hyphomonadaceae bacterium]|nr:hypothetical protein [Hyphomonadaceae bacterium]
MRMMICGVALMAAACATGQGAPSPSGDLNGRWIVDLSANPAEPYTKTMELKLAVDGTVAGSFYDSDIQAGRWKTDRGRTCVSFRTTDGAGPYHTSACLNGASVKGQALPGSSVQGQTWAEHRNFLFNWDAVRE